MNTTKCLGEFNNFNSILELLAHGKRKSKPIMQMVISTQDIKLVHFGQIKQK